MIIEISRNKYAKNSIGDEMLKKATEFFVENKDKWYNANELQVVLKYENIRMLVNRLRADGLSIVSDTRKGYKYTENKDEINECYKKLRQRCLIALTAAKQMKSFLQYIKQNKK